MGNKGTGLRRVWYLALVSCCVFLAACGKEQEGDTEGMSGAAEPVENIGMDGSLGTETSQGMGEAGDFGEDGKYLDIVSETKTIFAKKEGERGLALGMQYYQGEPVLLWTVSDTEWDWEAEAAVRTLDLYLKRADGSSELLLEDIPDDEAFTVSYLAEDGSIYNIEPDYARGKSYVVKWDGNGEALYKRELDMVATDICQLADGRMILLLTQIGSNGTNKAAELDPDTGAVAEIKEVGMGNGLHYIGAGTESLLVMDIMEEIREVDTEDGSRNSILVFANSSYDTLNNLSVRGGDIEDFRISEDGAVEILKLKDNEGIVETLRKKAVDKVPVVVRGFHFNNGWIRERVEAFNRSSDSYHIVLQEPGTEVDWNDFATQTSIQITTGKGPDILFGAVLDDYIQGMIDKGGFEDLRGYMEESGIKEEDYFPVAFDCWQDGDRIYGINASMNPYRYSIDASVLGENTEPDIDALVDALLAREEKGMYMRFYGSREILRMFLEGSETFWGMIDWEQGTCDFSGELFAKMLETAKRYAYDENLDYPILAEQTSCDSLVSFDAPSVQRGEGTMTIGVMFDDGCRPAQSPIYGVLGINANSSRKQGAWEFICFLLEEESQRAIGDSFSAPVLKKAFEAMVEKDLENLKKWGKTTIGSAYLFKGKYVEEEKEIYDGDITEEWVEAFMQAAEDTRALPIRTMPVLDIICDEAEDYFSGTKSIEEVAPIIRNRVQLYLDENHF